jgi:hypothetical protein
MRGRVLTTVDAGLAPRPEWQVRGSVCVAIRLRRCARVSGWPCCASFFCGVLRLARFGRGLPDGARQHLAHVRLISPRAAGACGDKSSPVHARARLVLPRGSLLQLRLDVGERPRIIVVCVGVGSYGVKLAAHACL